MQGIQNLWMFINGEYTQQERVRFNVPSEIPHLENLLKRVLKIVISKCNVSSCSMTCSHFANKLRIIQEFFCSSTSFFHLFISRVAFSDLSGMSLVLKIAVNFHIKHINITKTSNTPGKFAV